MPHIMSKDWPTPIMGVVLVLCKPQKMVQPDYLFSTNRFLVRGWYDRTRIQRMGTSYSHELSA